MNGNNVSERPKPRWVDDVCHRFGKVPSGEWKYRVIWGPDREEIRFGQTCKRYDDVDPCWILEIFVSHADYGAWDEESMGPKPPNGEYWASHYLQVEGQFISLEDLGPEILFMWIKVVDMGKDIPMWQKKAFRDEQFKKRHESWRKRFSDIYDECVGPFDENAVSGIPGKRTSADVKFADLSSLSPDLQKRLATRDGQIRQL